MAAVSARWGDTVDKRGAGAQSPVATSVADRMIGVAALALSGFLIAQLLSFGYGRDQGIYAVVAHAVLRGEVPYRDAWDFKPPGVFFVFALARALFGPGAYAVRLLEALGLGSLICAFAIISRRYLGNPVPGLVGGMFAVLAYVHLEFWNTAQPSSFAAVVVAWALVFATYEPASTPGHNARSFAAWLAAGALYGVAALLKPPLGGGILVSAAFLAARRRTPGRVTAARLLPIAVLGCGALLPILLVLVYFAARGGLRDMYEALFVFAPQYTALGLRGASFVDLLGRAVNEWLTDFSVANLIGLVLLCGLSPVSSREREGTLHVVGIIVIVLVGVALQAKFFPYHYGVALTLTGLLSGWGFWKLWVRLRSGAARIAAVGALATLSIAATLVMPVPVSQEPFLIRCSMRVASWLQPNLRTQTADELNSMAEVDAGTDRRVAEWLRTHTADDASIYIWGFAPVVYDSADRRPASRYIYNVPQRVVWAQGAFRKTLLADLLRDMPAVVLVEHGDRLPWVTGDARDSAEVLEEFSELKGLLTAAYEAAGSIGRFDLYRLRTTPPADQHA